MLRRELNRLALGAAALLATSAAHQAALAQTATLGANAPDFALPDTQGKTVNLASFKGRVVVLEWVNPDCPFVKKHYSANPRNMQALQADASSKGVVWLAINSTHTSHPDYRDAANMAAWMRTKAATTTATLMDTDGAVGLRYGAKTTPHMYIVDTTGRLVYAGGIDSIASARVDDMARATNHVQAALAEVLSGKPVSAASTTPYGCSVKYKS
jgi:hypothetical protein